MKACKMGQEAVWIDYNTGSVRMCGWTDMYHLGNLTEQTIEEIWNGDRAKKFRETLKDGTYRFCNHKNCPYCANGTLNAMMTEYDIPQYPKYVSLSYEPNCNYKCVFCRDELYVPCSNEQKNIERIERELAKFLDQAETISANGVGELFCSPSTLKVLAGLKYNPNINIGLESNGSLFNATNWEKIANLGKHNLSVSITVHSFDNATYQYLSGTDLPVSNVMNNLEFLHKLREMEIINTFTIATVICERNFREMPAFVEQALKYNPDKIRLRFFMPHSVQPLAIEWFFDIRNPMHPYHKEFLDVMKHPIFRHPKVWKWQGDAKPACGVHPYFDEKKKTLILAKLLKLLNNIDCVRKYFAQKNIKTISLYGNIEITESILTYLQQINEIEVIHLLETRSRGKECMSIPFESASKNNMDSDAIIVIAFSFIDDIVENLKQLNYVGQIISIVDFMDDICIDSELSKDCCKK